MNKKCSMCKQEKLKSEFNKRKDTACGVGPRCKPCQSEYHKSRKEKNEAYRAANRKVLLEKNAAYYSEKRGALLAQKKEYYVRKRAEILAKRKADYPQTNARMRKRAAENPVMNLGSVLRTRLTYAARTMGQKITSGRQLRADRDKIRQRLEVNFQPGMSWANYGTWHIDHVKPLAAFVAQGRDVNQANLLCNLRPMWGKENMLKSATFKGRYYRYTTGAEK